jgi:hypothetical protein
MAVAIVVATRAACPMPFVVDAGGRNTADGEPL